MAVQGIWSGTISFSLVAIPVRLVKAVDPGRVSFHLLHSADYSRLSRRMFCPEENVMVPLDEIVRGYEIAPERYVLMTDEELESVSPERSRTIEIAEFVDVREIDPIYFDHPYYLVPSKGGEKAYQLLAQVMRETNTAGIAKFVLAEREYLVAVANRDGALALITLHYMDELVPDGDLAPKQESTDDEEARRIRNSVERMIADFDPGKYVDNRRKKLLELLAAKVRENVTVSAPAGPDETDAGPPDLVAALEESMRNMKSR